MNEPRRAGIIWAAALVAGVACSGCHSSRSRQTTNEEARELVAAVTSGDVMRVESLLSSGVNPNVRAKRQGDDLGPPSLPPLDVAIGRGNQQMVQILLEHGANPNSVSSTNILLDPTLTPLTRAIQKGLPDIVQLLIDHGADVNRGGTKSPLAVALDQHDDRVVAMLLDNKALDLNGALCDAALDGNLSAVQRVLARNPKHQCVRRLGTAASRYGGQR